MLRILTLAVSLVCVAAAAGAVLVWSWTQTAYGPMDLGAAIVVHTMPAGDGALTPERRATANAWTARFMGEAQQVGEILEETFPSPAGRERARIYVPEGEGPFPLLVWIHGGGYWMGEPLELWDGRITPLVRDVPVVVVSLGYRLAPEHPFPAAVEDCWAGLQWSVENAARWNADPQRVAVMGGSAGGNLAAVMALRARDEGGPRLALQVLFVPTLNAGGPATESMRLFSSGYGLDGIETMRSAYFAHPEDARHAWASPLLVEDLSGLARALVVTAQFDPLRDEGEQYGRRLAEARVPVSIRRYDGAIHGLLGSPRSADEAMALTVRELRQAFGVER